jgi:hypothetical protein
VKADGPRANNPGAVPCPEKEETVADPWETYSDALGALSRARREHADAETRAARDLSERRQVVRQFGTWLADQSARLTALGHALGVPPAGLAPISPPVEPVDWATAVRDMDWHMRATEAAIAETERIAKLPQFLPWWKSPQARNAVVYWAMSIPFTIYMFTVTIFPFLEFVDWSFFGWIVFGAIIHPAIVAAAGTITIHSICIPKLGKEDPKPRPFLGALMATGWWFLIWKIVSLWNG